MTYSKPPICIACVHRLPPRDNLMSCEAFKYIPGDIAFNRLDHRFPIVGDGGIQFEQDPDRPVLDMEQVDAIFRAVAAGGE